MNLNSVSLSRGSALIAPFSIMLGNQQITISEISTTNQGKLHEYQKSGLDIKGIKVQPSERQLSGNENQLALLSHEHWLEISRHIAMNKAANAYSELGRPCLIEDTSLWLSAMPLITGPYIKQWCQREEELQMLCNIATMKNDRFARAIAVLAVSNGHEYKSWAGVVDGIIADSKRGQNGFGWDSIFIPEPNKQLTTYGFTQPLTWAEMDEEQKLGIFPFRGLAVSKLSREATHIDS